MSERALNQHTRQQRGESLFVVAAAAALVRRRCCLAALCCLPLTTPARAAAAAPAQSLGLRSSLPAVCSSSALVFGSLWRLPAALPV